MRKHEVEEIIQHLRPFAKPKRVYEQYMIQYTQTSICITSIKKYGDIEGKVIADLCGGTGMHGLTALICGAKRVYFYEIDPDAIEELKKNIAYLGVEKDVEIHNRDLRKATKDQFPSDIDTVICAPPFGNAKNEGIETCFMKLADKISEGPFYIVHKTLLRDVRILEN